MKAWLADNDVELKPELHREPRRHPGQAQGQRQAEGFDLITYYQGYKPLYAELGILGTIDDSKIPNLSRAVRVLERRPEELWINADGTRTGVPWTFGARSGSRTTRPRSTR